MELIRRHFLAGCGLAAGALAAEATPQTPVAPSERQLPRKGDFAIPAGHTYINCACTHPMTVASAENVKRYALSRSQPAGEGCERLDVKSEFPALIHANPSEIAFVSSTSAG